ncbi:S1C family serine protease [Nocardioides sp. Kera G14]|uniref:S1C family serine protease n=1 Tax=Nocardioides sp. Kera G14 TaxID=2884264 RepID=UPI001D112532|nr:trypsin-like peptidase domain-containing protein [Nocardioides sp. Kera G14]UDY24620.1 S1C family serine protease [Nocardioides sp. Kera G14]
MSDLQYDEPIGPSLPAGPSGPPPSARTGRSRRLRWRIAMAATAAFAVGCGVAGTTTALVEHAQTPSSTSVASSATAPTTDSSTQSTGWSGYGQPGYGYGSGTYGGYGSSGTYGSYGGFGASGSGQSGQSTDPGTGATADTTSDATSAQSTGLVEITSTLSNGTAAGTGMILTSSGVVVTNHHVVEGATSVKVTVVSTGKTYTATYVGGNATTDVAVLKLKDASGLTPVDLSDQAAQTGDTITSVGDANGDGGSLTASPGTVAALDQDITVQDDDGGSSNLSDLIELNAYIVPGDSGGAVLDSDGDVVGMNVAASSGGTTVEGYAIPIATVETLVDEILDGSTAAGITYGYPGYLGVGLDETSSTAVVAEVADGEAADRAGLEVGDTITSFDGHAVTSASALHDLVAATAPGDRVKVAWTDADGASHSATVTLGTGPIA